MRIKSVEFDGTGVEKTKTDNIERDFVQEEVQCDEDDRVLFSHAIPCHACLGRRSRSVGSIPGCSPVACLCEKGIATCEKRLSSDKSGRRKKEKQSAKMNGGVKKKKRAKRRKEGNCGAKKGERGANYYYLQ